MPGGAQASRSIIAAAVSVRSVLRHLIASTALNRYSRGAMVGASGEPAWSPRGDARSAASGGALAAPWGGGGRLLRDAGLDGGLARVDRGAGGRRVGGHPAQEGPQGHPLRLGEPREQLVLGLRQPLVELGQPAGAPLRRHGPAPPAIGGVRA